MTDGLDILFSNTDIITMDDKHPTIFNGCVGVSDGKITYVGSHRPTVPVKRIIDCKGRILMPGLINTHAHTAMCLMRGYADDYKLDEWLYNKVLPVEARLDERAVLAGFRLGAAEMLRNGTTSISDMYFFQPAVAKLALELGIRVSLSNAVVAIDPNGFDYKNDRSIVETIELMRYWHGAGDGRIRADVSIHAEYTSFPDVWRFMHEIAHEYGLITHLHLSETLSEHEECKKRYGKTPAQVFSDEGVFDSPVLAAHCVYIEPDDMDLMAQKGVSVSHCPVSNLKLASGLADIRAMILNGINVSLGTDGCCSNNSHDLFEEIKLAALLAKGLSKDPSAISAYQALKLATVNAAAAQGRAGQIGSIEEGYDADIILLDTGHLNLTPIYDPVSAVVYSGRGADVCLTMVQGRILYENGAFSSVDIEFARNEVLNYAMKVVNR